MFRIWICSVEAFHARITPSPKQRTKPRGFNDNPDIGGRFGDWWKEKACSRLVEDSIGCFIITHLPARKGFCMVMLASLDELGYVVEWRSINAADYGMPQRRRRVFILAYAPNTPLNERLTRPILSKTRCRRVLANALQRPSLLSCPSKSLRTEKRRRWPR